MPTKTPVMTVAPKVRYNGMEVAEYKVGDPVQDTPGAYAVLVDPALAQDWLDRYADPQKRIIRPARVAEYADDMAKGAWLWGTAVVAFTSNGSTHLDNGHHRLTAITKSGVPVWMLIVTGAEPAIRSVTDIGIGRTGGDNIRMWGGSDLPNEKASYIKMRLVYEQTVDTAIPWRPVTIGSLGITTPSKREVVDTWQADEALWHTIAFAIKTSRRFLPKGTPPKTVGAFVFLAEQAHPGEGVKFFLDLTAGHHPDVMTTLIRFTTGRPSSSGTQLEFDRKVMELLIRAFNAYRIGGTFKRPKAPFNLSRIK